MRVHLGGVPWQGTFRRSHPPRSKGLYYKNPTQQGGYVETKQPTYPREGRCVGRCVEDTGSLDWWYLLL
jgi:hypothetical protein